MFSQMSENTNKKINFDIISSGSSGNCVILNESDSQVAFMGRGQIYR